MYTLYVRRDYKTMLEPPKARPRACTRFLGYRQRKREEKSNAMKERKILKLIIFVGVFILVMISVSGKSGILKAISTSLMLACTAYIAATLFGVILAVTRNYLIAIVAFLILFFVGIFKLDSLTKSVSWLSDGFWAIIVILIGIALIARDILILRRPEDVS